MSPSWPSRLLLALGSGLALAFAFPPHNLPVLGWVSLGALMVASLEAGARLALLCGFLHGAAFSTATLPWIYTVMRVYGGLGPAEATAVLALLVAALALFPAVFAICVAYLGRRSLLLALVVAPFLWVVLEFVRTDVTGFPWYLLGYSVSAYLGLLQLAALTGIYGLSFLVVAYNALFAGIVVSHSARPWVAWLLTTAILVAVMLSGRWFIPVETPRRIAHLVQTNLPQSFSYPADWMETHAAELDELERLSINAGQKSPGLVVWPEAPAPFSFQDPKFAARAEGIARGARSYFLVGVDDWKRGPQGRLSLSNSAALVDPSGQRVFLYDKIHLVPFGEYVPLRRWLAFARNLTAEVGGFQPGSSYKVGELPGGKFGAFICYEAIFPAEVRRFVAGGAEVLINMSNDGWYGRSAALEQNLAMARVRAVENRRWLLRATNTGISVAVDPYGRYAARFTPYVRGVLDASYNFRGDRTLYSRWGDWWAWLCVGVTFGLCLGGILRRRKHQQGARKGSFSS